jgi:hypothetical protein
LVFWFPELISLTVQTDADFVPWRAGQDPFVLDIAQWLSLPLGIFIFGA